jgi:pentatricopeptide repeat protein
MEAMELELGKVTYLSVLKALGALAALDRGREVQELIERSELEADLFIASNLVDMHAKCGNLEEAKKLFEKMPYRSSITWNTLISGYALDGQAMEAFRLAKRMMEEEEKGIDPNHITLVGLLLACSHAGLVEEGFACFESICRLHGVLPAMEHYCCLVDALARAGCLADSLRVIELMPFEPNSTIWKALLGACRTCCDIDFARYVVDTSLAEPRDNATFVLLSNIFAAAGGWEALLTDTEEL